MVTSPTWPDYQPTASLTTFWAAAARVVMPLPPHRGRPPTCSLSPPEPLRCPQARLRPALDSTVPTKPRWCASQWVRQRPLPQARSETKTSRTEEKRWNALFHLFLFGLDFDCDTVLPET